MTICADSIDTTCVVLPKYYREGFFSGSALLHPEISGGRQGVAGDPIPYNIHNDNILTSVLLGCFILGVIALSSVRNLVVYQLRNFFYIKREGTTEVAETTTETLSMLFFVLLDSMLISLLFYFYTLERIADDFVLPSQYLLIVIFLAITVGYFMLRTLLYTVVDNVFFDAKRDKTWQKSLLVTVVMESLLLFPCVILHAYFALSIENVINYVTITLFVVKLLTFYKCFVIFFRRNIARFQIILYLCALEIVPLLALWSGLMATANSLKINL